MTLDGAATDNRIDPGLAEELREVCREMQEDEGIHLVILTATGTAFSVGREAPPAGLADGPTGQRLEWLHQMQVASSVAALQVPVIVSLNGDALDHGLELALAGDLRIAADHAKFGITDLARGSFPWDGGTQRLSRLVGPAWARDMILTSRTIDASEALSLGLVNRVVERARLTTETQALADSIMAGGPIAARYAKEAVLKGADLTLHQGLRLEADLNLLLQSTADRAEGIKSFRDKRTPQLEESG